MTEKQKAREYVFIAQDGQGRRKQREVYCHARRDSERAKRERIDYALRPVRSLPVKSFEKALETFTEQGRPETRESVLILKASVGGRDVPAPDATAQCYSRSGEPSPASTLLSTPVDHWLFSFPVVLSEIGLHQETWIDDSSRLSNESFHDHHPVVGDMFFETMEIEQPSDRWIEGPPRTRGLVNQTGDLTFEMSYMLEQGPINPDVDYDLGQFTCADYLFEASGSPVQAICGQAKTDEVTTHDLLHTDGSGAGLPRKSSWWST